MQAVLILAHKNVAQIIALSKRLMPYFEVYVHFDTKYRFPKCEKERLETMQGAHVYRRMDVRYGGVPSSTRSCYFARP